MTKKQTGNKTMTKKNTYAWDWILAEGDTVKEKGELLLKSVLMLCYFDEDAEPVTIHATPELGAILSVCAGGLPRTKFEPDYKEVRHGKIRAGTICRNLGKGYEAKYALYESESYPKYRVTVKAGRRSKTLLLFNCPLEDY